MKVFLDTNIYLDLFQNRVDFFEDSAAIFDLAEDDKIEIVTSAVNIANIYYLLHNGKSKCMNEPEAAKVIRDILTRAMVSPVDTGVIESAFYSDFKDKEDAIQYYSALRSKSKYFITRDVCDYASATEIKIISPRDFLQLKEISRLQKSR